MFQPKKIIDRAKIAKEKGLILDPFFKPFDVESDILFEIDSYKYDNYRGFDFYFYDHKTKVFSVIIDYNNNIIMKQHVGLTSPLKILDASLATWISKYIYIQGLKEAYTTYREIHPEEIVEFNNNVIFLANAIQAKFDTSLTESFAPKNIYNRKQ